jgi:hypothetical protein
MANNEDCSGLEVFYYAFRSQIKSNYDSIVVFVHWYLVKNGFVCINDGKVYLYLILYQKQKLN